MQTTNSADGSVMVRLAYGAGGIANGVFSNGLSFFLLIYYNLVIGLSAELAGLALGLALLVDAISDPLTGFWSDNLRSRLGRRHPFLYLSIIPVAVLFWLIWNPPADLTTEMDKFLFLLVTTIALRLAMTLYDVPHNAMVPELSGDYHERTRLAGMKVSASWIAGQIMVIAMYMIWLVPTPDNPYGILNQAGYQSAGLFSAVIIAIAILLTAVGLHKHIPLFSRTTHERSLGLGAFFRQLGGALGVPSLRAILFSSVSYAVAAGISSALWTYLMSFYWELTEDQIGMILAANLVGALVASVTFRFRVTKQGKKRAALELLFISLVVAALPYLLRYLDLMPANGSESLFWVLFVHGVIQVGLLVWLSAVTTSMTADIVEAGIVEHGHQSEGIITSVTTFVGKAGTAGGLFLSGSLLGLIAFPQNPDATNLTAEIISNLGVLFMIVSTVLFVVSAWFLSMYRISEQDHQDLSEEASRRKDTA